MMEPSVTRLLWLVFGGALLVLAWQFEDRLDLVFAGRGTLTVTDEGGTVKLAWRGKIEAPMASKLDEAFRTHGGGGQRFVLALASPGGELAHGYEVIRLLKAVERTNALETVVEGRNACASMCVPIYLAGTRRTASPDARFMFHEVSYRDAVSDQVTKVPAQAIERATDQLLERTFRPAGVDADWLARLREAMRGRDVWRTARQLVDERSGIVQALD